MEEQTPNIHEIRYQTRDEYISLLEKRKRFYEGVRNRALEIGSLGGLSCLVGGILSNKAGNIYLEEAFLYSALALISLGVIGTIISSRKTSQLEDMINLYRQE